MNHQQLAFSNQNLRFTPLYSTDIPFGTLLRCQAVALPGVHFSILVTLLVQGVKGNVGPDSARVGNSYRNVVKLKLPLSVSKKP